MAQKSEDWKAVLDQFEELKGHDSGPPIDEILDDEIRRRFGQTIARAVHKPSLRETLARVKVAR
jgi:hypothetical protein